MKNFITAPLSLLLSTLLLAPIPASAVTPCVWAANAPDTHRVRQGDTLWDLASLFLKNPWCWPQVWEQNRDAIQNPHWIFPGQMIVLDRVNGTLKLSNDLEGNAGFRSLSPGVRTQAIADSRIPLISAQLQAMLTQMPVLNTTQLRAAPSIVGFNEQRSMAGIGDTVFVRGDLGANSKFVVMRSTQKILDPDSGLLLGVAGLKIGRVRLASTGDSLHRFEVIASHSELKTGDRLVPFTDAPLSQLSLHPGKISAGKVAAVLHEGRWAGLHDRVAINRGTNHGLDAGSVLTVVRQVRIGSDENSQSHPPSDNVAAIATLLVFEVADQLSLAVVMQARDTVTTGDTILAAEPEQR